MHYIFNRKMESGRKNLIRWKPYGPIAAQESGENFDLPPSHQRILFSFMRQLVFARLSRYFYEHEEGHSARKSLRGPPSPLTSDTFLIQSLP